MDEPEQESDPRKGDNETGHDQRSLRELFGESRCSERRDQQPDGRGDEDDACPDGAVPANGLEEDGHDERHAREKK
jgi:hypothetical protein